MPKNPRKVAIVIVLGIFIVGCGVCGTGAYVIYARFWNVGPVAARAEKAEAAYRASGMPWVADDLNPHPPVADSENAAIPFKKAMEETDKVKGHKAGAIGTSLDDAARTGNVSELNRLLKPYGAALALVREASKRPRMDFHRDWDQNAAVLMPEFVYFKSFVKMLVAKAQAEAFEGRDQSALDDFREAQSLDRLLRSEPLLIGMLVQISCDTILEQAIERSAYMMRARPDALAGLVSLMKDPPAADFKTAMRFEAYMGIAMVRNLSAAQIFQMGNSLPSEPGSTPKRPLVRKGLPSGNLERAWATIHMELWTKVAKILEETQKDPTRNSKEMGALSDQIDKDRGVTNFLELILFPVLSQAIEAVVTQQARQRALSALLSAMEIRARTGKFPANLNDIPGVWIDPFTNSALKYKLTPTGVRVYSVGPTLVDHGGVAHSEAPKDSKVFDIVASCPPVSPLRK